MSRKPERARSGRPERAARSQATPSRRRIRAGGSFGRPFGRLSCAVLFVCLAGPSLAQSPQAPQPPPEGRDFGGPDAVPNRIESDRRQTDPVFRPGFLDPYWEWKGDLQKEHGLIYGAEYNATFLTASDRLPGADREAAGGIFRFSGSWELFARDTDHPGAVRFLFEHTHDFTDTLPSSFLIESAGNVGVSNLPYNDDGWRLNTLYWNQKFRGGKYEVVAGFLDISDYVDIYPLISPWTDFFNLAFSIGAGALDIPNDGALGLAGGAWLTDSVYAIAGLVDLNANPERPWKGFESFFQDHEYFKHFEIGWTGASKEAYFINNLHLTLWHTDDRADAEGGFGAVLSFNHSIGDKWLVFVRGAYAKESSSLLDRSVSIGAGYTPSGLATLGSGSQLGFGANWGRPNEILFGSGLRDQYTLEVYYRLSVTRELSITPSMQLLIDPALDPERSTNWIFGLRARLAL
jgi:porin